MITWILILFAHFGSIGQDNSLALTNVPGFGSKVECEQAGRAAESLTVSNFKNIEFVCVQQTRVEGK